MYHVASTLSLIQNLLMAKTSLCFWIFIASWFGGLDGNVTSGLAQQVDPILLQQLNQQSAVEVIISFRQPPFQVKKNLTKTAKGEAVYHELKKNAKISQAKTVAYFQKRQLPFTSYVVANALWSRLDADALKWVSTQPEVIYIEANPTLYQRPRTSSSLVLREQATWGISKIHADSVWALGYRGKGIVVGGQDTGIEWDNPYLKNAYRGWNGNAADHNYHWYDAIHTISPLNSDSLNPCGLNVTIPCDDDNHGTHTVGTMVGQLGDFTIGVAPEAKFIGCRCMERGWGSPQTYLECFEWFLAPRDIAGNKPNPALAPDVINNSWGCPFMEGCEQSNFQVLNQAILNLKAAGIAVVASAGNEGPSCTTIFYPPAMYEATFVVGAISPNDTIAGFSSRGPVAIDGSNRLKPNVTAPGVAVISTIIGGALGAWNGTSMASPHVAGAIALLLEAVPELRGQVEEIEMLLQNTARPVFDQQTCGAFAGSVHPNAVYGHGIIDVLAAIRAAQNTYVPDSPGITALTLFPNPTSDKVFIRDILGSNIQVFDAQGRLVLRQTCGDALCMVDLAQVTSGFYYLQVTNGAQVKTIKLMKL